jgi:hypothetical protein
MDIRILCYLASLLCATNTSLAADIKKWIDQNGQVHFGDIAPQGEDSVEINPKIITTAPSSDNSLRKIMRPGELRMIKNHEKRGKRLIKAKRKAQKQARADKRRAAKYKKQCSYYRQKKENLKRKLREGNSRSQAKRIRENLIRHELKIDEYCKQT